MPGSLKLIILYLGYVILVVLLKFILYFKVFQLKKKTAFCSYIHLLRLLSDSLLSSSLCRENEASSCLIICLGLKLVWRAEDEKLTIIKTKLNA